MKKKFSYITLSIFHNCELHIFAQNLQNNAEYKEEFRKGIISLKQDTLNISQYFDSTLGARFEKFTFWSSSHYPHTVFFMSNLPDGYNNFARCISRELNCPWTSIEACINEREESKCCFEHIDSLGNHRIVYSLKEDRWTFCDLGIPLDFENLDYYKCRTIKKRMNFEIIVEYLAKLGINLWDIDSEVSRCMTFERTAWQ